MAGHARGRDTRRERARKEADEATARWTLELGSGRTVSADDVVSAIGRFNEIVIPDIPGLDSFAGTLPALERALSGLDEEAYEAVRAARA